MYINMEVRIQINVMHVCRQTYMSQYMYLGLYGDMHDYVFLCTCIYVCVCMHICRQTCMSLYMYNVSQDE